MEEKNKVYIKTNSANEVTEINSDIFINDLSGWIKIDEGNGDKYAHAQSSYFDKPIITAGGDYVYEYVNGKVREKDQTANIERHAKETRIAELKRNLAATDYKAIKYAEGVLSSAEYESDRLQRQAWRDEINVLEGQL